MRRIFTNQTGAASLIAITTMVLLAAMATTYLSLSANGLSRLTGFGYGDNIKAKAAAEAGIRYTWMNAVQNTSTTNYIWDTTKLNTSAISVDSTDSNSPTFTISLTRITANLPSGVKNTDSYYKITSVGRSGNSKAITEAYLLVSPMVSLTEFVQGGNASNNAPWTVDTINGVATAPSSSDYYQILFNGDADYAAKGITYHYKINLNSTNPSHPNDTGYGIYYLANGTPNDMSAYVLQYDPGLTPDQILVKKVVADATSQQYPWYNEQIIGGTTADGYSNQSWQSSNASASWNTANTNKTTWTNTTTLILNETTSNPATGSFITLDNESTDTTYKKDIMSVQMSTVMAELNKLKANNTSSNQMLNQDHILTIDIKPVVVNGSQNYIHRIYIDGLEILRFVDRSTKYNFAKDPGYGQTGLRVWEAQAKFSNLKNAPGAISLRSWEIQKP
ncbi:hypothetical protein [Propionispora hippei]|uniref:PilX N-terminal n=1 Tax=Propionispora hippei DSM 15287 TaxID=1123003 RepID=A0A1M6AE64_9FIRM|nr:hypothetical protein [Propionispora hippei]SHI34844.1 hypothetical protein SAMN02745170_00131 [Propionispora hippei DSM 15287]